MEILTTTVMRIATQPQDPSACHTAAMHCKLAKKLGLQPGDTAETPAAPIFSWDLSDFVIDHRPPYFFLVFWKNYIRSCNCMVWFEALLEDGRGSHHLMNGQQNWIIFHVRSGSSPFVGW